MEKKTKLGEQIELRKAKFVGGVVGRFSSENKKGKTVLFFFLERKNKLNESKKKGISITLSFD